jgi:hypothetical protein
VKAALPIDDVVNNDLLISVLRESSGPRGKVILT